MENAKTRTQKGDKKEEQKWEEEEIKDIYVYEWKEEEEPTYILVDKSTGVNI